MSNLTFGARYAILGRVYPPASSEPPWENRAYLDKLQRKIKAQAKQQGLPVAVRLDEFPLVDSNAAGEGPIRSVSGILQGLIVYTGAEEVLRYTAFMRDLKTLLQLVYVKLANKPNYRPNAREAELLANADLADKKASLEMERNTTLLQNARVTAETALDAKGRLRFNLETGELRDA